MDQPIEDSTEAARGVAGTDTTAPRSSPSSTRWWIELGAAAVVAVVYLLGPRSIPSPTLIERADSNSWRLYDLERALHIDVERTVQWAATPHI